MIAISSDVLYQKLSDRVEELNIKISEIDELIRKNTCADLNFPEYLSIRKQELLHKKEEVLRTLKLFKF